LRVFRESAVAGVGIDGEAPPAQSAVRRANVARTDLDRWRDAVAQSLKVCERLLEGSDVDVFEEDVAGPALVDDACDVWPDAVESLVLVPSLLAGEAPRLTRESRSNAIHQSAPRARVERGDVRPDRRRSQTVLLHRLHQSRCGEGFPLHVSDCDASGDGEFEPEADAADAGAEFQGS